MNKIEELLKKCESVNEGKTEVKEAERLIKILDDVSVDINQNLAQTAGDGGNDKAMKILDDLADQVADARIKFEKYLKLIKSI